MKPTDTFLSPARTGTITLTQLQWQRGLNIYSLVTYMDQPHPLIQTQLQQERSRSRNTRSQWLLVLRDLALWFSELAKFTEGYYVLVSSEYFFENEKLCLRWRGPRSVLKALNDYVFKMEDLGDGETEYIHGTRYKYYADDSLDKQVIVSHVFASETGVPVSRLMKLVDENGTVNLHVRWKVFSPSDDTLESLIRVYEDDPQLVIIIISKVKLLDRKTRPPIYANASARN